jgi:hypothetical protein
MYKPEELQISRSYIDDWCAPYLHLEFLNSAQLTVHSLGNSPYNGSTFFGRARPNIRVVIKGAEEAGRDGKVNYIAKDKVQLGYEGGAV